MAKSLRYIVKEIQLKRGWTVEQVADSIDYSRVHLTREMQKKTENEALKQILLKAHGNIISTTNAIAVEELEHTYKHRTFEQKVYANFHSIAESQTQLARMAVLQLNQLALIRANLEGRPVVEVQDEINKEISGLADVKTGKGAGSQGRAKKGS